MLVRVFSDLHLEFGLGAIKKCVAISAANRAKYTILAGDITNFSKRDFILTQLVSELKPYTDHIIYVMGNHEYYDLGNMPYYQVENRYKALCSDLGITLLEDSCLETDDFVFYGATMWTDVNEEAFEKMSDRHSFTDRDEVVEMHEESVYQLVKFLAGYQTKKPLVVITHHLPSHSLVDGKYDRFIALRSGFSSDLDRFICAPVSYWVYGHTHEPNQTEMNGVKLFCNPGGYPKELKELKDCTF